MSWDPLYCGKKNKREKKGKERVEEISQNERQKIREEKRRKIMKKKWKEKNMPPIVVMTLARV